MASKKPEVAVLVAHARITNWYMLGVLLHLDTSKLDAIERENQNEDVRLSKMYEKWLATNPNATYNDVIKALENKLLEEITVALDLKEYLQKVDDDTDGTQSDESQNELSKSRSSTSVQSSTATGKTSAEDQMKRKRSMSNSEDAPICKLSRKDSLVHSVAMAEGSLATKPRFFISYCSKDDDVSKFAKEMKRRLEQAGHTAFIFQDPVKNPPGRVWSQRLAKEIANCDAFIAVITQKYLKSDICHQEIGYASDKKKLLLPVIYGQPEFSTGARYGESIEMIIKQVNYIKFEGDNFDAVIEELIGGIRPAAEESTDNADEVQTATGITSAQVEDQMRQNRSPEAIYKPNNLGIRDLVQISKALRDHDFGTTKWKDLGENLGLYKNTLDTIKSDTDTGGDRLRECLSAWLKLQDGVKKKGGATWSSLIKALRAFGENDVADGIEREYIK